MVYYGAADTSIGVAKAKVSDLIPEKYRFIVEHNPIAIYIQSVREALTYQNIVNLKFVIGSLIVSVLLIIVGNIYFKHSVKRVAEHF